MVCPGTCFDISDFERLPETKKPHLRATQRIILRATKRTKVKQSFRQKAKQKHRRSVAKKSREHAAAASRVTKVALKTGRGCAMGIQHPGSYNMQPYTTGGKLVFELASTDRGEMARARIKLKGPRAGHGPENQKFVIR